MNCRNRKPRGEVGWPLQSRRTRARGGGAKLRGNPIKELHPRCWGQLTIHEKIYTIVLQRLQSFLETV